MEVVAKLPSVDQRDSELRLVLKALGAFRRGETGVTLPTEWDGVYGKIAAEFNDLTAQTARTSQKLKAVEAGSRPAAKHRRLSDEKLTGFWQSDVAIVNSVLDEVDTLSEHTRTFLAALTDLKKGNATAQLPQDWTGVFGKVADAFNDVVAENLRMSHELARLSRVVGKEGKLKERAFVPNASGFWRDSAESINSLIADLVHPTSEVARVIGAVAQGDLSK
jgi:methyl-accepting chemotaxis protein